MEIVRATPKKPGWTSDLESVEITTRQITNDDRRKFIKAGKNSKQTQCVDVTIIVGDKRYTITAPNLTIELVTPKD